MRFNIDISTDSNIKPNNNNLASIVNYEDTINKITYITENKHHELLEDLAEKISYQIEADSISLLNSFKTGFFNRFVILIPPF
mgnify:CR=1 FL=1